MSCLPVPPLKIPGWELVVKELFSCRVASQPMKQFQGKAVGDGWYFCSQRHHYLHFRAREAQAQLFLSLVSVTRWIFALLSTPCGLYGLGWKQRLLG